MGFQVGVQLHPQATTVEDLRRAWREADTLGVDSIWIWDHFYPLYGDAAAAHFECYSLLAAMAVETEHARIGALVTCNSYRNPNLLADMARTIDHLSDGRFVLGIGAGWFERDYEEYGYEFGSAASRLRHLERNLPEIERRLDAVNPPPVRSMPILIAGRGEQITLRLVARHADSWHAGFPSEPASLEPKVEALIRWCAVEGQDPADIEWGVGVEPDDLDRFLDEDAEIYLGMGFTQFTLGFGGPGWRVSDGERWLSWRDGV